MDRSDAGIRICLDLVRPEKHPLHSRWGYTAPEYDPENRGWDTSEFDVFAFGVLLWRLMSSSPLPPRAFSSVEADHVIDLVKKGMRPEKQDEFGAEYEIMKGCWVESISKRSSLQNIARDLDTLLEAGRRRA